MAEIEITGQGCAKGAVIGAGAILAGVALCSLMGNTWSNRYGRCPQIYLPSISRPASPKAGNPYSLADKFEKIIFDPKTENCTCLEFSNDSGERTVEAMFKGKNAIRATDDNGNGDFEKVLYFPKAIWAGKDLRAAHGQRAYKITERNAALDEVARGIIEDAKEAFKEGHDNATKYKWYGERIE